MTIQYLNTQKKTVSSQNSQKNSAYQAIEINKQISKIAIENRHFKKRTTVNKVTESKQNIPKISQDALFLDDFTTDLTPMEISNILKSISGLQVEEINEFSYSATYAYQSEELVFDEVTEDLITEIINIPISFTIKIGQLVENPERFAILFQNKNKDYYMEFMKIRHSVVLSAIRQN